MNGSFDLLILNNAEAAPTVDWLMVIAGIVLLESVCSCSLN